MDTQYSGKLTGKMLYFMEQTDGAFDAANDCMAVPVERLKGFRANGTTTQLLMEFDPMLGYAAGEAAGTHDDTFVGDSVLLTVTTNKHKEVNMVKEGIVDPVLVTKSALKNAVSVALTIMSADCVISNIRIPNASN